MAAAAHYLGGLVRAGPVTQESRGRTVIDRADDDATRGTLAFPTSESCAGVQVAGDAVMTTRPCRPGAAPVRCSPGPRVGGRSGSHPC